MKIFSTTDGFQERLVHAGFWSFALQGTTRGLGLVRTVIVARLMAPDDIGLFALAFLALVSIETFTMTGFGSALIQRKGDIQSELNVAWTAQVLQGFLQATFLVILAPVFAAFFNEPAVLSLVRLFAVSSACSGFSNIGVIHFRKEIEFHKYFRYMMSKLLPDLLVSILAAVLLRNAWALAFGLVAGYLCQTLASYRLHPFRPRLRWDARVLSGLFRYGIWLNLSGIMVFIGSHGASMAVGKVIGAYSLGLYQMANWISQAALAEVSMALNLVLFPVYARMQQDLPWFRRTFVTMAGFALSIVIPVAVAILLAGHLFVAIFLGEKWFDMIVPLQLLTVAAVFHSISLTGVPAFKGAGDTYTAFQLQGSRAVALLLVIYPLARWGGIVGAAGAMLIAGFAMCVLWYVKIRRLLGLRGGDLVQMFGPPLIAAAVIAGVTSLFFLLSGSFDPTERGALGFLWFFGLAVVCTVSWGGVFRLLQPFFPGNQPLRAFEILLGKGKKENSFENGASGGEAK